jgi:hypothetical protein
VAYLYFGAWLLHNLNPPPLRPPCRQTLPLPTDILESIFATPSTEPPATAYSQPALHDSSSHGSQAFPHSAPLPRRRHLLFSRITFA